MFFYKRRLLFYDFCVVARETRMTVEDFCKIGKNSARRGFEVFEGSDRVDFHVTYRITCHLRQKLVLNS